MRDYLYRLATDKEKGFIAGIIKFFLAVLSFVYGLLIRILIIFRRTNPIRLSCKVISIGNITLGGTGKTVLVEYIARYLQENGHKVAILTRGYKRKVTQGTRAARHGLTEEDKAASYEKMGDEAYMLAKKLTGIPVLVDADRLRAAKKALRDYCADTLILDDGFQQWHIRKDLEIVTLDAQNPFGNKRIIPRGILREPLANLKRAEIFVLTKTNINPDAKALSAFLESLNPCARIFKSVHKPVEFINLNRSQEPIGPETLKGKSAVLFCGIGDPDSFAELASGLGINVAAFIKFADHHDYSRNDMDKIIMAAKEKNIDTIITTEKDAARVGAMSQGLRFLALRIEVEIENEQEFCNRLLGMYSG